MSRANPRLVYWIAGLHDHGDLTDAHHRILIYLVTKRLDYGTGRGYCAVATLADATGHDERTVKRALALARKLNLIERTRRGHRLGDGRVMASEWQVIYPPISRGHGCPVEVNLKGTLGGSQGDTSTPPSVSESTTVSETNGAAANSPRSRVHDGSGNEVPDVQRIPDPATVPSRAADRNAREVDAGQAERISKGHDDDDQAERTVNGHAPARTVQDRSDGDRLPNGDASPALVASWLAALKPGGSVEGAK